MIKELLNKGQAEALFQKEAVMMGNSDAVPYFRMVELFGEPAARFMERSQRGDGYLAPGKDWNGAGACSAERPFMRYLYKPGFMKVVSEHNYLLTCEEHQNSEGGRLIDQIFHERSKRLDGSDERRKNTGKK